MIDYYAKVAPVMIPHLTGRPVTLRRFPEGVEDLDAAFFEKRCPKHRPKWVKTTRVEAGPHAGKIDFCVCDGLPTLIWMAQLASIEFHPSLSKARAPKRPTVLAFDLDPGPPAEDLGLEGDAGLRPPQLQKGELRGDQTVRQSDRPAARETDPGRGPLENEKSRTRGQGLRRLVAEPPQQNDDRRLQPARPRTADRLHPGDLGRGRRGRRLR